LPPTPTLPAPRIPSTAVAEALLMAALGAHRDGTLPGWLQRHRGTLGWLDRELLPLVRGTAGEALRDDPSQVTAMSWLLRWAIGRLRPDHAPADAPITREDWLLRTSWRPMLAALCHFGFAPVPAFRDRYHAQPDELAVSHLCGLWGVGPSTYYRYLDRARIALAALLRPGTLDAAQRLSLRTDVQALVDRRQGLADAAAREAWHARQAALALAVGDAVHALWHQAQTRDIGSVAALVAGRLAELAPEPETDGMVEQCLALPLDARTRGDLLLAQAGLWRTRGDAERELAACQQALRLAAAADDALMLGRVYAVLGKYHEPRDADRALAFYEDCTDNLWRAGVGDQPGDPDAPAAPVIEEYVVALARLAWLFLVRNDPRSKATLERADGLRERHALSLTALARLEATWGEYWRRAGEPARGLEHQHRALNLYERLGDGQAVLKTCCNLSLVYGELRDFERAIAHAQRVIELAGSTAVEPELLARTHLNIGTAHFWQDERDAAAHAFEQALQVATDHALRLDIGRANYNLAEIAYLRFKDSGDPADEQRGDAHVAAALAVWPSDSDAANAEATRRLKAEVLNAPTVPVADRLAPQEEVVHPAEMAVVREQREILAVPAAPDTLVRARLRIAQAYLSAATKEREAALALMQRHGLDGRFDDELAALQSTWERELTLEQQLARRWSGTTGDLMSPERAQTVLTQVLRQGVINKSGYAELCGVSPATASKHLAQLAERGLLQQTGKGPSTRYVLVSSG
jgi:tetratricopeptide (TPR) repeat protein